MIGGRKSRSNKGKKRTPYGPRSRTRSGAKFRGSKVVKKVKSKKVFRNNVSNVTNNAPLIRTGTNVRPTFNTVNNKAQRKRKVRSNKGKKRGPYGPHSRTRSGKKFKVRGGSHKHCSERTPQECVSNISNRCMGFVVDLQDRSTRKWTKSTKYGSNLEFDTQPDCEADTLSRCQSNTCFMASR